MKSIPHIRKILFTLLASFFLISCNFRAAGPAQPAASAIPQSEPTGTMPAVNLATGAATTGPAATGTASPCATSPDGTLRLCFLNLTDGQTIAATPGQPITVSAEASGATVAGISLSTDVGGYAQFVENSKGSDPFRADFSWTPSLGSGAYRLTLETLTADKSESTSVALSATVTGLTSVSPTPSLAPGAVPAAVKDQVVGIYSKLFGINIVTPVIARKFRYGVEDPWISTAYIGNEFYEVEIYPDGHTAAYVNPIFPNTNIDLKNSYFKEPVCRPAGVYSMLVVFLDFGNLSAGKDEILSDLAAATQTVNGEYAAYPSAGSGSAPILQIQTTGVILPVPKEIKGKLISLDQVRAYTGVDPLKFQWLAQVDLDSTSTFRATIPAPNSFGYAFSNCPAVRSQPNIQVTVDAKSELAGQGNRLADTLLSHEVFHLFGYPASHAWPCINSVTQKDAADECVDTTIPALMLGWVDTDGDGIPEILDSTPYGIKNS